MKTIEDDISTWESEGGSLTEAVLSTSAVRRVWADRIQAKMNARFNHVINALQALALKQSTEEDRLTIFTIMLVLEERRGEMLVSGRDDCFIHDWQERAMDWHNSGFGERVNFRPAQELRENPTSQRGSPYQVFRVGLRHTRGAPEEPSDS
jgi:hypothetical protein